MGHSFNRNRSFQDEFHHPARYGWIVIAACTILMMAGLGIYYSFSVFFSSLQAEFGWTRAQTASVFSLYLVFSGIFSIAAGRALDRLGPRVVVVVMGLATGLSLVLMSGIHTAFELYIYYSVLLSLGTGPVYIIAMGTASQWFVRKRGTAVGIVGAGSALGTVILSPIGAWLITAYSWRQAYLVIGLLAVAVMLPAGLLLKKPPFAPDRVSAAGLSGESAPRTAPFSTMKITAATSFQIFFIIWFCYSFCLHLVMGHLVPKAEDLGMDRISAAATMSVLTATVIPCRLFSGIIADRIDRKTFFVIMALLHILVMAWATFACRPWMVFVFAGLYGFVYGAIDPPVIALVGDAFGAANIGSIMGLLMVAWGLGSAIGPYFGGLVFDLTGSYSPAFIVGGLSMGLAALYGCRLKL